MWLEHPCEVHTLEPALHWEHILHEVCLRHLHSYLLSTSLQVLVKIIGCKHSACNLREIEWEASLRQLSLNICHACLRKV